VLKHVTISSVPLDTLPDVLGVTFTVISRAMSIYPPHARKTPLLLYTRSQTSQTPSVHSACLYTQRLLESILTG